MTHFAGLDKTARCLIIDNGENKPRIQEKIEKGHVYVGYHAEIIDIFNLRNFEKKKFKNFSFIIFVFLI